MEVSELSDLLKKRLNLPDAPMMPVGFAAAAAPEEEEAAPVKVLKNLNSQNFNLILFRSR